MDLALAFFFFLIYDDNHNINNKNRFYINNLTDVRRVSFIFILNKLIPYFVVVYLSSLLKLSYYVSSSVKSPEC